MLQSVDLLLKAVDKAIQLLTFRTESRRRVFKELVEPLFRDLEPVVEDYFSLFSKSIEEVKAAKNSEVHLAVRNIRELREQMLVARIKVQQLAETINKTSNDPRLADFATRILAIFYCTRQGSVKMSRSAEVSELLDTLMLEDLGNAKGFIIDSIRRSKDDVAVAGKTWPAPTQFSGSEALNRFPTPAWRLFVGLLSCRTKVRNAADCGGPVEQALPQWMK